MNVNLRNFTNNYYNKYIRLDRKTIEERRNQILGKSVISKSDIEAQKKMDTIAAKRRGEENYQPKSDDEYAKQVVSIASLGVEIILDDGTRWKADVEEKMTLEESLAYHNKEIDKAYRNENKSNPFKLVGSSNARSNFGGFRAAKYGTVFYNYLKEVMPNEIDEGTKHQLNQMTVNANGVVGCEFQTENNSFLDKGESTLLVGASIAALKTYANENLTGDVKEGFEHLIGLYRSAMNDAIDDPRRNKPFHEGMANMAMHSSNSAFGGKHAYSYKLLGSAYNSAEERPMQYVAYEDLFQKIQQENKKEFHEIKELYLKFALGDVEDDYAKSLLSERFDSIVVAMLQFFN